MPPFTSYKKKQKEIQASLVYSIAQKYCTYSIRPAGRPAGTLGPRGGGRAGAAGVLGCSDGVVRVVARRRHSFSASWSSTSSCSILDQAYRVELALAAASQLSLCH